MTHPRLPAHPVPANVAGIFTGSRGEFKRFPPETVDSIPVTWRESHNAQSLTSPGATVTPRLRHPSFATLGVWTVPIQGNAVFEYGQTGAYGHV